ncbi:MAG: hypothetical protein IPM63_03660 [Acidobacteriota bacterium]|nr:MAG: hypothetical protein IPM63_03660 [Acidobacteriota bacterium]
MFALPDPGVVPRDPGEQELSLLEGPGRFDWVLFPDILSVERLGFLAESRGVDLFQFDSCVICALGEAVADQLRFIQLHADIIPSDLTERSIARSVADYAGGEPVLGKRTLLVIGSVEEALPRGLPIGSFGGIETLWLFELRRGGLQGFAREKALFKGGAADAVFVSSAYDLVLLRVLEQAHGFDVLGSGEEILCADELTKSALRELGLEARVV